MYSIPSNIDFNFMYRRELLQICVSKYNLILNFDDNLQVSMECSFAIVESSLSDLKTYQTESSITELISLLGFEILGVNYDGNGNLALHFSNGTSLEIYNSNGSDFESYQISYRDKNIIV